VRGHAHFLTWCSDKGRRVYGLPVKDVDIASIEAIDSVCWFDDPVHPPLVPYARGGFSGEQDPVAGMAGDTKPAHQREPGWGMRGRGGRLRFFEPPPPGCHPALHNGVSKSGKKQPPIVVMGQFDLGG
jgi:hypothetical protein